jgi:putative acetyltransferase
MQNEELTITAGNDHPATQKAYSIRQAKPEDLPIAFPLVAEYFQEIDVLVRDSKEEFADYLVGDGGGVWLAFAREEPVGCIVLRGLSSPLASGEVKRLYVRASHRKRGLADGLLRALEQYAIQVGYDWLYLDTKDDLENAIRFYKRHGYECCDRYNNNPQAAVFMRKRLSAAWPERRFPSVTIYDPDRLNPSIRSFQPGDEVDFRRLNEEWITRYFYLEEKDSRALMDPKQSILLPGGYIAMAVIRGNAVGCCALVRLDDTSLEVAKMAVTPAWQGRGLGRKLLKHVIRQAGRLGAKRLYLETNSGLVPAIRLYESLGFRHLPPERVTPSSYQRANVYMELLLHAFDTDRDPGS